MSVLGFLILDIFSNFISEFLKSTDFTRYNFKKCVKLKSGCKILLHPVKKPELYGVAKLGKKNKVHSLKEKPKNSK